jgi:hypothetical protein
MRLRRPKSEQHAELELPERSDAVTLVRPSGERVQARVAERNGEELLVALMFRPEAPLHPGRLEGLLLEFTSPRGRVRLHGAVTLLERELLRFSDLRPAELLQEREYVRVQATRPVLVSGSTGNSIQTFSVDLSGGGMLLAGPATLKVGERIQFRLITAQGSPPISGLGIVVRIDSQGRRAVCFEEIGEGDHRRLVRFIFECQRLARQRGLESDSRGR